MTTRISEITVARLYNLGNFENMKYDVQVIVEDGNVDAAFDMARATIEAQHARFEQERKDVQEREREEREAERERQRLERQARLERVAPQGPPVDDPEF